MKNPAVLVIQPVSIAGRLIVSSITDGIEQNFGRDVQIVVFDELFDKNINQYLINEYDVIIGYDFSPLKIKIDNGMKAKGICYFADNIESKTSGQEWDKYFPYLYNDDVYTFLWDKEMMKMYNFPHFYYLPQFVNFEIYKDFCMEPEFDVMFAGRLDTDFRLDTFISLRKCLPDLKFAWYAIERHYEDALKRTTDKELIETAYKGFIDNEPDMAKAINNAKILFSMNAQGISSLNHRTIQAVACKRLMISDRRGELSLYVGNMPYWESVEELARKIRFYLNNPAEYDRCVEECWKIGRKNHHSKECVKYMFDKVLAPYA